jgi:hypothetical protein
MNETKLDISDGQRAQLRVLIAAIQIDIGCLSREGTAEAHSAAALTLRASWAGLVEILDVGPAPEVRTCPSCGNVGMRAALRCGYCWKALSPPPRQAPLPQ